MKLRMKVTKTGAANPEGSLSKIYAEGCDFEVPRDMPRDVAEAFLHRDVAEVVAAGGDPKSEAAQNGESATPPGPSENKADAPNEEKTVAPDETPSVEVPVTASEEAEHAVPVHVLEEVPAVEEVPANPASPRRRQPSA